MKNTFLRTFITICSIFLTIACSKDNIIPGNRCNENWAKLTEAERKDLTEKLSTYSQSPTVQNCEAYKASYLAYINALKKAGTCFLNPSDKAEYQQALNNAEAEAREIDCANVE